MKILLAAINAKYIHSNLAVYSLKAFAQTYAKEHTGEIGIAEYTINHQTDDILMDLYKKKPDVLAFSCYIWNIDYVKELTAELAKLLPDTELWLGGPEVSYDAVRVLEECPHIRGIIRGEGEETFLELTEYYLGGGQHRRADTDAPEAVKTGADADVPGAGSGGPGSPEALLRRIRGITCRAGGEIFETLGREPLDMDRIPFVYKDLRQFENRILYYETSRGCPFSCSYCLSSIDKRVRLRSFSLVREELDFFLRNRVHQVKFVDRTFNCSKKHAMEIWRYLAEHDNGVTNFHFEISADLLGEEELALLLTMRPGLVQLEIGVQSTNPETIREIRRTMDLERLRETVSAIHKGRNIHQHLDLIAGLPGEDYESFRRSYKEVYAMEPQQLQLGFLKVLKGSPMEADAAGYGIVYKNRAPYEVLYTRWLPYEDVLRLKSVEEMTEVYYNSGQFAHTMRRLVKEFENPFDLYEELGVYYERNGLDKKNHSRISRYDILLDFIREKFPHDEQREQMYRDLMVLDLYLRENMKSRPDWAAELSPFKETLSAFYRREEERRLYLKSYDGFQARQLAKMTHVEIFHSPVLESVVKWTDAPGIYPLLFDYRSRDALTGEAAVYPLGAEDGFF